MKCNKTTIIIIMFILLVCVGMYKKENFPHRGQLSSTYWINQPERVGHTFPELKLSYGCQRQYFATACSTNNPNNAEICKNTKHRFDPNQL